eukprot:6181650-Pleurochrysis_carterae.AAC.4
MPQRQLPSGMVAGAFTWKACSTLIASLALVSKWGISPLAVHHARARFCVTCVAAHAGRDRTRKSSRQCTGRRIQRRRHKPSISMQSPAGWLLRRWRSCSMNTVQSRGAPLANPGPPCCQARRKESYQDPEARPGSKTRPSTSPSFQKSLPNSRHNKVRTNQLLGKRRLRGSESAPGQQYPRSASQPARAVTCRFRVDCRGRSKILWGSLKESYALRCASVACMVTSRSSTMISFVRKSAPMVALYLQKGSTIGVMNASHDLFLYKCACTFLAQYQPLPRARFLQLHNPTPVSYTHLTLPTILLV